MKNIKLVDPINTQNSVIKAEPKDSVLSFVLKFQNQLSIESLLNTFDECVRSIHSISGVRYRYPLLGITHQVGQKLSPQCHLHLEAYDEFLGDITIYHSTAINSAAIKSIELITSLLTHPLRAIIQEKANSLLTGNEEAIGVANAVLVEQLVSREAKLAHRERVPMSLILFDIDRFENIAQNYGFITRDEILYQVMQVMRNCIRDTDLLFRYEDDTYCLILKGVTTQNSLLISERIRKAIDICEFKVNIEKSLHLTISSGIAKLESNDSIESIFSRATNAMVHAKKMGRNQSIIADGLFIT